MHSDRQKMSLITTCAGCLNTIEAQHYLRCSACTDTYDLLCANISENRFISAMTTDQKSTWKCQRCVCNEPKGNNTDTPVRGMVAGCKDDSIDVSACLDRSELDPFDNITVRRHTAAGTGSIKVPRDLEDRIRKIIKEELQSALNERLTSLISKNIEKQIATIFYKVDQLNTRLGALETKLEMAASSAITGAQPNSIPSCSNMAKVAKEKTKTAPSKSRLSKQMSSAPKSSELVPPEPVPVPSVSETSNLDVTYASKLTEKVFRAINETVISEHDGEGWTEVKRPRKPLGVKRGTALPGATKLEASERSHHIHVYYLKIGTTDENVRSHLEVVCGEDACRVETLKARGNYASFKLIVPSRYAEKVMDPSNWAKDIAVKPWRQFFRTQSAKNRENSQSPE